MNNKITYCARCGQQLEKTQKVCPKCGKKKMPILKIGLVVAVILLIGVIAVVLLSGKSTTVEIVNESGYAVTAIYIRKSGSFDWGDNLLSGGRLNNRSSTMVTHHLKKSNIDVRLIDIDEDTLTKRNVVGNQNRLVFNDNDWD